MTAATLLAELHGAGIRLSLHGHSLRVEGKPGVLSPELRERLATVKPEQVARMRSNLRVRLLSLAADELLPAELVHRLDDADIAACAGLDAPTLREYLRALHREAGMAQGIVPEGWDAVAHCDACGPVRWHAAERLRACAWCKHRKALRAIPRPPVLCGDCAHYLRDPRNPVAGMGSCSARDGQAYWPGTLHRCPVMRPMEERHDTLT